MTLNITNCHTAQTATYPLTYDEDSGNYQSVTNLSNVLHEVLLPTIVAGVVNQWPLYLEGCAEFGEEPTQEGFALYLYENSK